VRQVSEAEPVLNPVPIVLLNLKLDTDEALRPELGLTDFALSHEVCRLLDRLEEINNGVIGRIVIRAGIPHRLLFASYPEPRADQIRYGQGRAIQICKASREGCRISNTSMLMPFEINGRDGRVWPWHCRDGIKANRNVFFLDESATALHVGPLF
jgi:hypothetical protein